MAGNTQKQPQKRRRPSAKETRARMARAVGTESPITRVEDEPEPIEDAVSEQVEEPVAGRVEETAEESVEDTAVGRVEEKPAASPEHETAGGTGAPVDGGGEAMATSAAAPAAKPRPERRSTRPVEEKLVRLSVDVPRTQHRFLRVEAATTGTTGMAVVRQLITMMQDDPVLAERVRERLEAGR